MVQSAPAAAIELRSVVKRFGELTAVDHLDLTVPHGICLGLLGPNGAGKSTTMRMLTAQAIATEGSISVLGFGLPQDQRRRGWRWASSRVGQPRRRADLPPDPDRVRTAVPRPRPNALRPCSGHWGSPTSTGRADTIVRELSGGMRRRLLVARGLIHRPQLVLLDEPTVGLDPQVRQELWTLIDGLRADGVTVLMSTHYIEEAERLADTVAVMSAGRIIAQGTPAELVLDHAGREVVEVYGPPAQLAELEADAERTRLAATGAAVPPSRCCDAEQLDGDAPEGVRRPANLEDAFVALTGQEIE